MTDRRKEHKRKGQCPILAVGVLLRFWDFWWRIRHYIFWRPFILNIYPWSSQDTLVFVYLWGKSDFTDSECPLMHMSIVPDLAWSSTWIQPIPINMLAFCLLQRVLICANNNSPWTHQNPSIAQSRTLVCRETMITSWVVFFWLLELPVSNRYFSLSCLSFSLLLLLPRPDLSSSLCACVSGKHMMSFSGWIFLN